MELAGYKVGKEIGHGGMATIYKGQQLSLQRPVAIKVLQKNLLAHKDIRKLFERESYIIANLNHPNIINVIDQGITKQGLPYFVMNYVEGIGLDIVIRKGGVKLKAALDMFSQIAKALSYAHKNGVIHRDIKPANILVDREGTVRILDFGIAQFYRDFGHGMPNEESYVMGTNSYLAPETKQSASNATNRSDIYSFGVVMYQFFTAQFPRENITSPRYINTSLPTDIDKLILDCLENDPGKRPESFDEIKNILLRSLKGGHLKEKQREEASLGLKNNFQLLDIIKEDPQGAVYLFVEKTSKKLLVIKKAPRASRGYEQAKAIAEIKHKNIAEIVGTSKNHRTFILVMEYCSGGTLAERLSHPFHLIEFLPIAIGISDGLKTAHRAKILHGNLRPSNILFTDNGVVKLTDFGFSKHYGKPSKEQNWYSVEDEEPSEASDIYSAGILFYQMLVGKLPTRKFLKFIPCEQFLTLPEELQDLITKMLHLDPEKRISNFRRVADTLHCIHEDEETMIVENAFHNQDSNIPKQLLESEFERTNPPKKGSWKTPTLVILLFTFALDAYLYLSGTFDKIIQQFFR